MFVRLHTTYWTFRFLRIKGIPTFLRGRKAAKFKHCAMSIDQGRSDNPVRSENDKGKSCCIIALDDVRPLCEIFLANYVTIRDIPAHWTFKVTIHRSFEGSSIDDQAPNLPQRRLLEPFTVLHDIPEFEVVGSVSSAYCTSIAAQVSRMSPTMVTCYKGIAQLGDRGQKEADRNNFRESIALHKMAFARLHYFFLPRMTKMRDRGALLPGAESVTYRTRLNIRANLASLHYRLEEWEDAKFWASNWARYELEILKTLPWKLIHAKLVYIAAISSVLIDKREKALKWIYWGLKSVTPDIYQDREIFTLRKRAWWLMRGGGEAEDQRLRRALGMG